PEDEFPFQTLSGQTYDVGAYEKSMDEALRVVGYDQVRAEQKARRANGNGKHLGIGIAVYVEITGFGGNEFGSVEVHPDGSVTVLTGTSPHGQGHATAWAMLTSDRLGIPIEKITVKH